MIVLLPSFDPRPVWRVLLTQVLLEVAVLNEPISTCCCSLFMSQPSKCPSAPALMTCHYCWSTALCLPTGVCMFHRKCGFFTVNLFIVWLMWPTKDPGGEHYNFKCTFKIFRTHFSRTNWACLAAGLADGLAGCHILYTGPLLFEESS